MLTVGYGLAVNQREAFKERAKRIKSNYLAPNTHDSYRTGKLCFLAFMMMMGWSTSDPVTDAQLADFIVFCCDVKKMRVDSVKTYLFGVRAMHLERGQPWTVWSQRFQVYQALRGCKRLFGAGRIRVKLEMSLELLNEIHTWLFSGEGQKRFGEANAATFWAAILTGTFGLLRKDNVSVEKANAFNPNRCTAREDFDFSDKATTWLKVRWSKTIQFGQRFHWVPFVSTGSKLDVRSALLRCFKLTPGSATELGPAFQWFSQGKFSPLTHRQLTSTLRTAVAATGRDPKEYSGISLRRGGATIAANAGVPEQFIKLQGDWASDAYQRYIKLELSKRLHLPKAMAKLARRFT